VLGVCWDGTGFGPDQTIWGGEFLHVIGWTTPSFERAAHFRTFRLPGGEKAVREPRRAALGLLYEMLGNRWLDRDDLAPVQNFSARERAVLHRLLARGVNAPLTSSAGRLFDAVAAILGLRQKNQYEGQGAMDLEFALPEDAAEAGCYHFDFRGPATGDPRGAMVCDWEPLVRGILDDLAGGLVGATIAAKFHNGLVEVIIAVARQVGEERVVLTGGCFQNRYLTERAVHRLRNEGFRPYWHQRIPPNDGGIALGQVVGAARRLRRNP
jgi:hydrogenase maturation protein HypF